MKGIFSIFSCVHQIHFHLRDLLKLQGEKWFSRELLNGFFGFFTGQKCSVFTLFTPKNTARHDTQNKTPKVKSDFQDKDNLFMKICVVFTVKEYVLDHGPLKSCSYCLDTYFQGAKWCDNCFINDRWAVELPNPNPRNLNFLTNPTLHPPALNTFLLGGLEFLFPCF